MQAFFVPAIYRRLINFFEQRMQMLRLLLLLNALLWPALSAAESNDPTAICSEKGKILVKKCQKLAESGNAEAQEILGTMYLNGEGVPGDADQAAVWFHKAAEQGNASAQYNLGLFYLMGMAVPQDYVQAHVMFNLSAASGYEKAIESCEEVAKVMTASQIKEAQKLAREWEKKHKKKKR